MGSVEWLDEPEDHDFDAAAQYLSLISRCGAEVADRFRTVKECEFYAKDILRASGLTPLTRRNEHVAKDLRKIRDGRRLSPVLLVRGQPLVIADGFHRVCAAYAVGENELVRCRIVSWGYSPLPP
jgi:hypothetical protein